MRPIARAVFAAAASLTLSFTAAPALASPPVAPTGPLTPEQERATFKLPPGFEAQLVAAEPDIRKPMNIAFDARGRLWVTDTVEYPWPVKEGTKGRDAVKVLSDFDDAGRARKVTTFADGLNIPLGVLPLDDGKTVSALVYSIPEVRRYTDADGDGAADRADRVLGTYGFVDTHGMTNNFVRGFDGWVYANHGFKNESTVRAADGSEVKMNSGNTYRFRPDGSRVEFHARGQVNPFGLCFDPLGNLYSADCHTRPQYLLLRGAVYPSFGKPDDGLGFGPEMCAHSHGSTAIAGTAFYAADAFPPEYQGNLFNGNPVTNAINRDTLKWTGSSPKAVEASDLLTSTDPWFRPVQVTLGPDGALYVADFYNKIIGHYEVDLKHPGRDRDRGRIWRIVYKGDGAAAKAAPRLPDLTKLDAAGLVALLGDANVNVRLMATNFLVDRGGDDTIEPLRQAVAKPTAWPQRAHALWALERLGKMTPDLLRTGATDPTAAGVRVHAMRLLSERPTWSDDDRKLAVAGLTDADATVRRAAADALGRRPDPAAVRPLLAARSGADPADTHLVHALKIALRDTLASPGTIAKLPLAELTDAERKAIAAVIPAVPGEEAGAFVVSYLKADGVDRDTAAKFLRHAARHVPERDVDGLAAVVTAKFADDVDLQFELFKAVREALTQRGGKPGAGVADWGKALATRVLAPASSAPAAESPAWANHPLPGQPSGGTDPWTYQPRKCADGKDADLLSSHPRGEQLTGVLKSRPFDLPPSLSLYVAGHNGPPGEKTPGKNVIRLRADGTDEVLAESPPPRDDTARKVTWDLKAHAGKRGYIEAVDADGAASYAWIAFGRLAPAVVPMPAGGATDDAKRQEAAAEVAAWLKLKDLTPALQKLATAAPTAPAARAAAAKAIVQIDPAGGVAMLAGPLDDAAAAPAVREAAAAALAPVDSDAARTALANALKTAPQKLQQAIAAALAGTKPGAEALLTAVAEGKASPRLLQDKSVRDRLNQSKPADLVARVARLTRGMPDADEAIQRVIDQRRAAFAGLATTAGTAKVDLNRGRESFAKNCAACHRVGDLGAQVGPQLDGAGKRGHERLIEDVLDPNRNVDAAFRYSVLTLDTGDVLTGLQRREEGETLVFADAQGKEFTVQKKQVTKRTESQLSLMPGNFADLIPPEEFNHLLGFLLSK